MTKRRVRSIRGQSLTEYTALIAFVGLIVAMVFSLGQGHLFTSVSGAYSGLANSLGQLNDVSTSAGH